MQVRALLLTAPLLAGLMAAAPVTRAAAQGVSRVAPAFGNTVVSTYPDGRQQAIWLRPDGTWNGLSRKRTPLAGVWEMRADKLCLKQTQPPTLPLSYCTPFPGEVHPGVVWTSRDLGGTPIQLKLVHGMTQLAGGAPTP